METRLDEAERPINTLGEIHRETGHIPTKEEELEWKKEQLRLVFGSEQFERMLLDAKEFFRLYPESVRYS